MNSLAQKKSSRMTVSTNMSGVSRKTEYRARNQEKTQEQMRRDYEVRKSKDNYRENKKDIDALSDRRKTSVKRYHEMTTINPKVTWDDIVTDLKNSQDAKTQRGVKKYTTVDDFSKYVAEKLKNRMVYIEYEPFPKDDTTVLGQFIEWYMRWFSSKDKIVYDVSNRETYPPAWNIHREGALNSLMNYTDESLLEMNKVPKDDRQPFSDYRRRSWPEVESALYDYIAEFRRIGKHDTIIPASVSKKCPIEPYTWCEKEGMYKYTLDDFERDLKNGTIKKGYLASDDYGFAIMCSGIVCVDFDTPEAYEILSRKGILKGGVVEYTKRGVHVYFTHMIDNFKDEDDTIIPNGTMDTVHRVLGIDLEKTVDFLALNHVSSSRTPTIDNYTRATVMCYPTQGYERVNDFFELKPFSMDLLKWWCDLVPEDKSPGYTSGVDITVDDPEFVNGIEQMFNGKFDNARETSSGISYRFHRTANSVCPGGHTHVSNGFYINVDNESNRVFYRCLSSECNRSYPLGFAGSMFIDDTENVQSVRENQEFFKSFDRNRFIELIGKLRGPDGTHSKEALTLLCEEFSKYYVLVRGIGIDHVVELSYIRQGVFDMPKTCDYNNFRNSANTDYKLNVSKNLAGDNIYCNDGFFNIWCRATVAAKSIIFNPTRKYGMVKAGDDTNHYNIWVGCRGTRYSDIGSLGDDFTGIEDILTVLRNLCANDDERYHYVINWINAVVSGVKTGKCLCFVNAAGGVGKGTFWNRFMYKYIVGKEMSYTTQEKNDIVGQFNGRAIENNLLLVFDEASYTQDEFNAIKNITSEETVSIADKNVKQRDIESFVNLVMLSNNLVPGLDDRRMVYLIPNPDFKDNEILEQFNKDLSHPEDSIGHKLMEHRAGLFLRYVRDMASKHPVNLTKKPRADYQIYVTYSDDYVRHIAETMNDIRNLLQADGRRKSVDQTQVRGLIRRNFMRDMTAEFCDDTCHITLLDKLGFKEGVGVETSIRIPTYIIPTIEQFNQAIKKHATIHETNM